MGSCVMIIDLMLLITLLVLLHMTKPDVVFVVLLWIKIYAFILFVCVCVVELLSVFIGYFKAAWQYISMLQCSEKHSRKCSACVMLPLHVWSATGILLCPQ